MIPIAKIIESCDLQHVPCIEMPDGYKGCDPFFVLRPHARLNELQRDILHKEWRDDRPRRWPWLLLPLGSLGYLAYLVWRAFA